MSVLSVCGDASAFVKNIRANPEVRIQRRGRWHTGTAEVLAPTPETTAQLGRYARSMLLRIASEPKVVRRDVQLTSDLLTHECSRCRSVRVAEDDTQRYRASSRRRHVREQVGYASADQQRVLVHTFGATSHAGRPGRRGQTDGLPDHVAQRQILGTR